MTGSDAARATGGMFVSARPASEPEAGPRNDRHLLRFGGGSFTGWLGIVAESPSTSNDGELVLQEAHLAVARFSGARQ